MLLPVASNLPFFLRSPEQARLEAFGHGYFDFFSLEAVIICFCVPALSVKESALNYLQVVLNLTTFVRMKY